ncbi:MAG: GspE/PulE family protein [bacterium]|nr:GspE/PulE family protein [bacterium]
MTISFNEERQNEQLSALKKKQEEELISALAEGYNLASVDLRPIPINMEALRLVPEEKARRAQLAAFNKLGKRVSIAARLPKSEETKTVLEDLDKAGFETVLFIASTSSLEKAWSKYAELSYATESKKGSLEISDVEIEKEIKTFKNISDVEKSVKDSLQSKKSARISHVVEIVIAGALWSGASDIHMEPEEENVRLRYRLDGVLNNILSFDLETYAFILSRIKLLSGLKLNVKAEAQDGRFSVHLGKDDIEIRTSILPGAYEESIVLRLLNPKAISVPLESLGIEPKLFKLLMREVEKPNGMLLTTGPTGSGKTTTLYAFLKRVHKPAVKIITIEDPIEYHLPGIVQTQVESEKGYSFASGLRSSLRQDPDIIMVGEIRDKETASIAINAALTGHLVFSTLHTNNAAGAFPRLIDLGINPKIITSAVSVVMAQRLLRKLCDNCKSQVSLQEEDEKFVKKVIDSLPEEEKKDLPKDRLKVWQATGCEKCNKSGYKGRIGVFEAILTDESVEKIVIQNPSERDIKEAAITQGILSMVQDGVIKVLKGVTSLEELKRVVEMD